MLRLPPLYPITDTSLSGLPHFEQVKLLAAGGASLIQLRDKDSSPREFRREAGKAMELALALGVQIIINDRVDVAMAVSAHGVHLGQDDMPPVAARRLLGEAALIGFSTHSPSQAVQALSQPIDYLAIGPIFPTASKSDSAPLVGLEGLQSVRTLIGTKPLVAIGGINLRNASQTLAAGADSVAVISALYENLAELTNVTQRFLALK